MVKDSNMKALTNLGYSKTTFSNGFNEKCFYKKLKKCVVGLGYLGITCSPRDPIFEGSNPAEIDGFFSGRKNPDHKSPGRELGVPSLRFQTR